MNERMNGDSFIHSLLLSARSRSWEDWNGLELLKSSHSALLTADMPPLASLLVDKGTLSEGIRAACRVGLQRL